MRPKTIKTRKFEPPLAAGKPQEAAPPANGVAKPDASETILERNASEWPVFDSIAHCAALTSIPKDRLQWAKNSGAPGFRGSRVYLADVLPWMMSRLFKPKSEAREPIIETWSDLLDKQKFEERAGILVEFEKAMSIVRDSLAPIRQTFLSLPSSMSARCNPSDPEHARAALETWVKQQMRLLADEERSRIPKDEIEPAKP